jgi:hypothetical protein
MEKICFVIQPFDERNNKRYKSVIEPAIKTAGLTPYRVDMDKSVQTPREYRRKNQRKSNLFC